MLYFFADGTYSQKSARAAGRIRDRLPTLLHCCRGYRRTTRKANFQCAALKNVGCKTLLPEMDYQEPRLSSPAVPRSRSTRRFGLARRIEASSQIVDFHNVEGVQYGKLGLGRVPPGYLSDIRDHGSAGCREIHWKRILRKADAQDRDVRFPNDPISAR